ncbi:hypothetical protein EV401DRAFT_937142 [Pisolithus croceorrhizus]|nr:hypothetical protein EV401DRAFT_937142 [Pisolithus croceorrhizus]
MGADINTPLRKCGQRSVRQYRLGHVIRPPRPFYFNLATGCARVDDPEPTVLQEPIRRIDCLTYSRMNFVLRRYVPGLIEGDLDSLRVDVQDYCSSKGISVTQDHDQNSTELMKCVIHPRTRETRESGGRFPLF